MRTLNLGILAHVDAGKTSLTERLLFAAGVIDEIGSVDDGSTATDSLALERQRGITIKSAVVSFVIDDVTVNLIDTPGHPDFIAEVERVLSVLDGAVLVISAVEGVQAQTRVLMRTLQRLHIPTLMFVNKIDRGGAQYDRVLRDIREKLTPAVVPMGSVDCLGTRAASFALRPVDELAGLPGLVDVLADHDDAFLAAYVDDETAVSNGRLRDLLRTQSKRASVHPVFFGSAITGAGVEPLFANLARFLPSATGDADGPVDGTVFKIERGSAAEKVAFVRMRSGTVRTRDVLQLSNGKENKVTAIGVFHEGSIARRTSVTAGEIGKLWGLDDAKVGDAIGLSSAAPSRHHFAPPSLETVVVPRRTADKGALHTALTQLAEQDPLINFRQDELRQELSVSLYGEVQKEVIEATLADDFGVDVTFRETTTICIERPVGSGADFELIGKDPNPFLAQVGLRVDPAALGAGIDFQLEVELGSMPFSFFRAVEETVRSTLHQGLYGWEVTDCIVTMTHSGYYPRQSHMHGTFDKSMSSTAGDFRNLTRLVLMCALKRAGTTVYEPIDRFHLELPADLVGPMLPALARLQGASEPLELRGTTAVLEGDIPAARVHELRQRLPGLSRGEGLLECGFDRFEPVRGAIPTRARWDDNPLDRKEYLLHVQRRV